MKPTTPKAIIVPDHGDWLVAHGRNLLHHTSRIQTVTTDPRGITFHSAVRDDVIAALSAAGYLVTQPSQTSQPRRDAHRWTHRRYVSDSDDRHTPQLPAYAQLQHFGWVIVEDGPGGHWRDETHECRRCTPQ